MDARLTFSLILVSCVISCHCLPRIKRQSLVQLACRRDPTLPYCPKPSTTTTTHVQTTVATTEKSTTKATTKATTKETKTTATTTKKPTTTTEQKEPPTTTESTTTSTETFAPRRIELNDLPPPTIEPIGHIRRITILVDDPEQFLPYCAEYKERYHYYCFRIEEQEPQLVQKLLKYCPLYRRYCNPLHTSPKPTFPTVPPSSSQEPCVRSCKAPHCTEKCKCWYYKAEVYQQCVKDPQEGRGLPFLQNNCQLWWTHCKKYLTPEQIEKINYELPEKYRPKNDGDPISKHNQRQHAQFWSAPESQHTDWLNGDIRQGKDWAVPALGISGTESESSVKFPSLGSFLGKKR